MNAVVTSSKTATERLADHVVGLRYDDLADDVVAQVKMLLVHHLGNAFRGAQAEDGRRVAEMVLDLSGDGGTCSIIGNERRAGLIDTVFANAFFMSHKGMDDFSMPAGIHPGVIVQPTAWAVGERTAASGRELITAVVVGYDAIGKLANTIWAWGERQPRRANAVFAPFGAAAAAARLQSLPREQVVDALGQAAHGAMGLIEGGEYPWVIHPLLARNGVMAAALARSGFPTAPTMVDGEHGLFQSFFGHLPDKLDHSLASLGDEFEVCRVSTKRYQSSGLNIVPMQLMLDLVHAHGLRPDVIERVDVAIPITREARERVLEAGLTQPGATSTSRVSSLRFQLAIILADAKIDDARYDAPMDRVVAGLVDRVHLHFEDRDAPRYARIDVTTTDGTHHNAEADDYVIPPVDPLEWLRSGGSGLLLDEQLVRLAELIHRLEDVDDVREVLACIVPNAAADRPRAL